MPQIAALLPHSFDGLRNSVQICLVMRPEAQFGKVPRSAAGQIENPLLPQKIDKLVCSSVKLDKIYIALSLLGAAP